MTKETPEGKLLEKGESTYKNGEGSSVCGGVISKSTFLSDPWAYMMAWVMEDKDFEAYKKLVDAGWQKEKERSKFFKQHAVSMI